MKEVKKKDISCWQTVGFVVTVLFGSLLHFLYDWTGWTVLASISAVNESTWEHMKIFFFPTFLFAVAEFFPFRVYRNFWWIKLKGILFGLILIPTAFYTLRGIFGDLPDWINISIFFLSAAVAYLCETKEFKVGKEFTRYPCVPLIILIVIAISFILLTFFPLHIPLFLDPTSGKYGI